MNDENIEYAVRRLMPVECLRLQGMPDTWFDAVPHRDAAAYKACGNGMTLDVVVYVLEGIEDVMERMGNEEF